QYDRGPTADQRTFLILKHDEYRGPGLHVRADTPRARTPPRLPSPSPRERAICMLDDFFDEAVMVDRPRVLTSEASVAASRSTGAAKTWCARTAEGKICPGTPSEVDDDQGQREDGLCVAGTYPHGTASTTGESGRTTGESSTDDG